MYPPRQDYPGAKWLITNRGIAKRAVFETREDVERFQNAIADVVDPGLLEVDAFSFLTTHFHLQVMSPLGEISRAMQLITNAFVRWFNRARKRDGPLFARRFHGSRIEGPDHWVAVLRYIDLNPVRAGMCALPSDHPYGSARAYRFGDAPDWLSRRRVVEALAEWTAPLAPSPEDYDALATAAKSETVAYLVERAARDPAREAPPLTDLIRTASLRQQGWMEWKAALADGMAVGTAFLPANAVRRVARVVVRTLSRDPLPTGHKTLERDLWAGLLRTTAGRSVTEIAEDVGVSRSTALLAIRRHEAWMTTAPRYERAVQRALQSAVRRELPPPRSPLELPIRVGGRGA